jgi:acyl-coenzyme A thioesterase PaaI-like protein
MAQAFAELVESVRRFQALLAGARPGAQSSTRVTELIDQASEMLLPVQVSEIKQIGGKFTDVPGRAQTLVPPLSYDSAEPGRVTGKVTFSRYYHGAGGAAHGGTIPLVFDEMLGRLLGGSDRPRSRTAYLNVNFRQITPIEKELSFEARISKVEGRKQFIEGKITDGDALLADAEGLFVTLRPGQP